MSRIILVTGAGGQVGHALAEMETRHRVAALTRQELDITSGGQVARSIESVRPDLVINAAAYTQVDRAERERALAYAINRDGVAKLAAACEEAGIPLLHISTDYVFDGSKRDAYVEDDPIAPLGVYGASKAEGEAVIRASLEQHIILRTSWVFSATGNNFVKTMLRLGKERDELGIVDDQHGCPTSARSIADTLLRIADRYFRRADIDWGTYHCSNRPETTWFGFAEEIFRQACGYKALKLKPIATRDYPTPAARPMNSVLDCTRLEKNFGIRRRNWKEELKPVLESLGN